MVDNNETLFGNEWIDYDKTYAKIIVDKDGIYRVTRQELAENGIPVSSISFDRLQLWNYGKEVGFYIGPDDSYIEFYGEKNKTQIDRFLFEDQDLMLNRKYSFITDDAAYFATWTEEINDLVFEESIVDLSNNTLSPEAYYLHTEEVVLSSTHYKSSLAEQVRYSDFVSTEGYGSGLKTENNVNVPIVRKAGVDINGALYVRYGGNNFPHRTSATINGVAQGEFQSVLDTVQELNFEVPAPMLEDNSIEIKLRGTLPGTNDKNIISEVALTYPREFHMGENSVYRVSLSPSATIRYVEIDGYSESELPVIYDIRNNTRIIAEFTLDGKVGVLIDPSSQGSELLISKPSTAFDQPKEVVRRNFVSYADRSDAEFLMVTSADLRTDGNTDWVQAYSDYRSSEVGGDYITSIVDVDQLYDQFAYGVNRHFISLKNYAHWVIANYDDPKFLFIVGKGMEYPEIRNEAVAEEMTDFQVPTWGVPGSDNLLLSTFDSHVPLLPVGRIAATSAEDVKNYLDKVRDQELNVNNPATLEGRRWQKNVLHLSGGAGANEQQSLFNSLAIMADTIENNLMGANVSTFRKTSTDPIENATSDLIFDEIKNGLSLISFFGHASVGAFDFNLDNVENYENKGKYPLLMSLGCYSGNIHTRFGGISESFVLTKDKGSIAFVAASGSAYISTQNLFGKEFYSELGGDSYGDPIGIALVKVIDTFSAFQNSGSVTFYQQLTYHGDPAVRLPSFRTPDYLVDASSVNTNPQIIDTYEESFEVCFDVVNIGKNTADSIDVLIQHENPQGGIEYETTSRIKGPANNQNLCVNIPISSTDLVGRNKILVTVDNANEIEELPAPDAESNNILRNQSGTEGHEFFILNNSAVPTFPEEFAIVNTEKVVLTANTFNAFGDPQTYFVEIDTTILFDSPSLRKREFNEIKSLVKWELDFALANETVYYWRVGSRNDASSDIIWRESSFVYEPGQRAGWSQEHYFQFLENDFDNIEYEDGTRQMKFVDNVKEVKMDNGIVSQPDAFTEFFINSQLWNRWRSNNNGINSGVGLVVFDPVLGNTLISYADNPLWGSAPPDAALSFYIQFPTSTQEERQHLISVLKDSIPSDHIVCVNFLQVNLVNRNNLEEWEEDKDVLGTTIFEVLEERGAQRLDELKDLGPLPYIYVYENKFENGFYKTISEEIALSENEQANSLFQVKTLWDRGEVATSYIGPASQWDELEWNVNFSNFPENDTVNVDIIGLNVDGEEVLLFENLPLANFDLSEIDANSYPYIKLKMFSSDSENLSTATLDKLRVYYTGIGDLALNTDEGYKFESSKLDEGEKLSLSLRIDNISNVSVGNTNLDFDVTDDQNNTTKYSTEVPALGANESSIQSIDIDTRGLVGDHILQVQLNQNKSPNEKYYFNNFSLAKFEVVKDSINPLLDVTFDGVQIMNDDIVSSKPLIRIELDDSNPYLLLDDPTSFVIALTAPDQEQVQISVDDPSINFLPAESGEENRAVIEYNPEFLEDGRYTLSVQSRDASGNSSANLDYEINFRVFNEEMVSNVFNYPNPFSTSTQFIFTLTGNEEPANMLIRIMTMTGKVVREITASELGTLRIGTNRTDFKWDGTDEFGEQLGNGTYLYQVITKKLDGSDYNSFTDPSQDNTDHLFTEGFGKLVIMR